MKIGIVVGSTRPGRVGPALAHWLCETVSGLSQAQAGLLDLADFDLPVFDEPRHPRTGDYQNPHTADWARAVAEFDAYVFVTPEYNHLPPSALVNAITFLGPEWHFKPVTFLSYGGVSGGLRAVQHLKLQLLAVKSVPISEAIVVPHVSKHVADGQFVANDTQRTAAEAVVAAFDRWTLALSNLRQTAGAAA